MLAGNFALWAEVLAGARLVGGAAGVAVYYAVLGQALYVCPEGAVNWYITEGLLCFGHDFCESCCYGEDLGGLRSCEVVGGPEGAVRVAGEGALASLAADVRVEDVGREHVKELYRAGGWGRLRCVCGRDGVG